MVFGIFCLCSKVGVKIVLGCMFEGVWWLVLLYVQCFVQWLQECLGYVCGGSGIIGFGQGGNQGVVDYDIISFYCYCCCIGCIFDVEIGYYWYVGVLVQVVQVGVGGVVVQVVGCIGDVGEVDVVQVVLGYCGQGVQLCIGGGW